MCESMADSNRSHFHVTKKEYKTNFSFDCDSSNVVYLFNCVVCGFQYLGSTRTPFKLRYNDYKACYRKLQPPRICKGSNAKIKYDSAIGQHLIQSPECAKTYTGYNFRIIGQARSSFHLRHRLH